MPYAAMLTRYGLPDMLDWSRVAPPGSGPGQIRIRVHAGEVSPASHYLPGHRTGRSQFTQGTVACAPAAWVEFASSRDQTGTSMPNQPISMADPPTGDWQHG